MTRSKTWALLLCLLPFSFHPTQAGPVKSWSASTEEEFALGTLEGTAIDAEGRVRLAPPQRTLWGPEEGIVWAVRPAGRDAALVALSGPGRVLRVAEGLPAVTLYEAPGESLITTMIADNRGGAILGLSPEGQVLRIGVAGGEAVVAETEATFVWSLAQEPDGTLWVGTGLPGRLLRIGPKGEIKTVLETGDDPVRCIGLSGDGAVIIGTGGRGRVIRVGADGKAFVLLDADEAEVVSVETTGGGEVYALTANGQKQPSAKPERAKEKPREEAGAMHVVVTASADDEEREETVPQMPERAARPPARRFASPVGGALYRLDPDGSTTRIWTTATEIPFSLVALDADRLLVATGEQGRIWTLDREGEPALLLRIPSNQASAMDALADGRVLVGGTTDARVVLLGAESRSEGTYLGPPVDAGATADWGRLRWNAEQPAGSEVRVSVRVGNTAEPDETWTDWREPGELPATRWFQARVELKSGKRGAPLLTGLDLRFRPRNRAPEILELAVQDPGVVWIRGPVQSSTRRGPLIADDPVARQAAVSMTRNGGPVGAMRKAYEAGARTIAWKTVDPDGDRLHGSLEIRREGDPAWHPLASDLTEEFHSWDARSIPDGDYRVRLNVNDGPDNAEGTARHASRVSAIFPVDNTRPSVGDPEVKDEEGGWSVSFVVRDPGGRIAATEIAVDDGSWRPLLPLDGVADSDEEAYETFLSGRSLKVRAVDDGGNLGGAMWTVPAL